MSTKVPGLAIETVLWGHGLDLRQLADDLRDKCKWQSFNEETGEFKCAFYEMPSDDTVQWIAQNSRPWKFSAHTTWI